MTESPLLLEIKDEVAFLTLNRPHAGNAIDRSLAVALADVAIRCQTDTGIRCVVLTGAGRLFCAGGDINDFRSGSEGAAHLSELVGLFHLAMARLHGMAKPFLVAVNGPAAGAGFSLAVSGDVVLCARSANFTAAYPTLGLTPDGGMSWLLPRLTGLRKAQEIMLSNRRIGADEAEAIGLVTRVVPDEHLAAETALAARALTAAPTGALGATRRLLQVSFESSYESHLEREARAIIAATVGPEHEERLSTFMSARQGRGRKG